MEGGSKVINKYLKKIPGIQIRTEKKKKFYTLMDIEEQPTLF